MNRRDFSAQLAVAGLGATALGLPLAASAQVSSSEFITLGQPLKTEPGKIDVVEFFWYGCPHCAAFEPSLEAWVKTLPANVSFRRIPAAFRKAQEPHQRLYFTLESMGLVDTIHPRVFRTIHGGGRNYLDNEASILDFIRAQKTVDVNKFQSLFNSLAVTAKCKRAERLAEDYKVDGVPAIGVGGRFLTGPAKVAPQASVQATYARTLDVAMHLIQRKA